MSRATLFWRKIESLHAPILVLAFQLAVSFAYINYFRRSFDFTGWIMPVHLSIVAGLFMAVLLCAGFVLLIGHVGGWNLSRCFPALIPAAAFVSLIALYAADFAANMLWGNSINYRVFLQYLFRRDLFRTELPFASPWLFIGILGGALFIFAIYRAFSGPLVAGLSELFLPGRAYSLFKDRRRAIKSGIALILLFSAYVGYLAVLAKGLHAGGIVRAEPIFSFFTNTNAIYDFNQSALAEKLRQEEPGIRAAYAASQTFQKKNVIVIMVDSLRADRMQIYGYPRPTTPFLAGLIESGRLRKVELATSTCAESNCGILSTMASKTLRGLVPENFKLHDLLHDQGYDTYFLLSGNHDWYGLREAYGKEMTLYHEGVHSTKYSFNDDRIIFEGLSKVPDYGGTPSFFYFHLMSVHLLGIKQERYRKYNPSRVKYNWDAVFRGEYDPETIGNNYDNGVIQADAVIREIFGSLEEKGYLANSVVAILADHGEGLGERGKSNYGHVLSLYQEFINIPLLFYDQEDIRYANTQFATQIDVAPTIIDRLGLPIPSSWEGRSLLDPEIRQYSFHQTKLEIPCYAVLSRTDQAVYKYMYWTRGNKEELFELMGDPREKHDLRLTADAGLIEEMRKRLEVELLRF